MHKVDASIVLSDVEYDLLKSVQSIFKIPFARFINGGNINFEDRRGIVFFGSFKHDPNIDAVNYFINDIFPIILEKNKNIIFHIAGSYCPDEIKNINHKNIKVHGYVKNIDKFLNQFKLAVVPIRFGAGIKGKIATSLSNGTPAVVSKLASEGMGLTHNKNILIAKNRNDYVKYILDLVSNKDKWNSLSRAGEDYAIKRFGYNTAYKNFQTLLKKLKIDENHPQLRLNNKLYH